MIAVLLLLACIGARAERVSIAIGQVTVPGAAMCDNQVRLATLQLARETPWSACLAVMLHVPVFNGGNESTLVALAMPPLSSASAHTVAAETSTMMVLSVACNAESTSLPIACTCHDQASTVRIGSGLVSMVVDVPTSGDMRHAIILGAASGASMSMCIALLVVAACRFRRSPRPTGTVYFKRPDMSKYDRVMIDDEADETILDNPK